MSAEQRQALEAVLRQNSFPADSDINEQRRLLKELVAGQPLPSELTVTPATSMPPHAEGCPLPRPPTRSRMNADRSSRKAFM